MPPNVPHSHRYFPNHHNFRLLLFSRIQKFTTGLTTSHFDYVHVQKIMKLNFMLYGSRTIAVHFIFTNLPIFCPFFVSPLYLMMFNLMEENFCAFRWKIICLKLWRSNRLSTAPCEYVNDSHVRFNEVA